MKKTKLTLLFAFGLLVLGGAHEAQSVQAVAASNTTTVTGKVELDYTFTPSETPEMKQWINSTLADARTDLTTQIAQETDPDKRKIYQDTLKELQSTSADSISTTDAQGNTVINGILPNAQVTIGNQTVTADTKGNYTVKNVPKVEKDAVVSYQNSEVFEAPINTSNTNQDNLKVTANSSDISKAIFTHANNYNFGVVRDYCGHGVGFDLHEQPSIPNYIANGSSPRLKAGMVFAIEPMINIGGDKIIILNDKWTVKTADHSNSAHFEHTVAVLEDKTEILTCL